MGDIITLDHMIDSGDGSFASSVTGDTVALVIKDLWSGLFNCIPCRSKSADNTYQGLLRFTGRRTVGQAYADNSPEIKSACDDLRIPLENSLPGVPQTNSIAERTNQDVTGMTRTALVAAGIPACFWPYAAPAVFCLIKTVS